ncbi:hypothetical protein CY35_08G026000 [Sphagnum magellanicum]|nr:hypothetical protein CY35_08G026000 [Sphagnum magellanicum]
MCPQLISQAFEVTNSAQTLAHCTGLIWTRLASTFNLVSGCTFILQTVHKLFTGHLMAEVTIHRLRAMKVEMFHHSFRCRLYQDHMRIVTKANKHGSLPYVSKHMHAERLQLNTRLSSSSSLIVEGTTKGVNIGVAWQYFGDLHIFGRNFICAERFRMMNKFLAALSGLHLACS